MYVSMHVCKALETTVTVLYLREKTYVQSLSFLLLENNTIFFFQNKRGMKYKTFDFGFFLHEHIGKESVLFIVILAAKDNHTALPFKTLLEITAVPSIQCFSHSTTNETTNQCNLIGALILKFCFAADNHLQQLHFPWCTLSMLHLTWNLDIFF